MLHGCSNSLVLTLSAAQQVNEVEGDDGKKGIGQGGIWLNARVQNPPQKKNRKEKNLDEKKGGKIKISKKKKKTKKRGSISFTTTARLTIFCCFSGLVCTHRRYRSEFCRSKMYFSFFFLDYRPCAHISQCFSIYSFLLVPPYGLYNKLLNARACAHPFGD